MSVGDKGWREPNNDYRENLTPLSSIIIIIFEALVVSLNYHHYNYPCFRRECHHQHPHHPPAPAHFNGRLASTFGSWSIKNTVVTHRDSFLVAIGVWSLNIAVDLTIVNILQTNKQTKQT